jgi:parallel beta-helix repeat protein
MPVYLSPLGGAGGQFFDNNGAPLSGGKLFTYAAGTTTPLATYTSSSGTTPNTNPIILNAAGRLNGSSEIWLTGGMTYKFVLTDANDVLIGTYDQMSGINDGSVFTADLANTANPTKGDALVGFRQSDAAGLLPGATARTVHQKLQETVSVKDFGAVGDGVTDDTSALQSAIASGKPLYFPAGIYRCTTLLTRTTGDLVLVGDGPSVSEVQFTGSTASTAGVYYTQQLYENFARVENLTFSTTTGYAVNKNALHIDGTPQLDAGSPSLTQNRSNPRIAINNFCVTGTNNSANAGWSAGIKITCLGWFNISNYTYIGDFSQGNGTGNWKGQGIWVQGAGLPVEGRVSNFSIYSAEFGVLIPDYFEGIYLSQFDMVNVQYGVYAEYNATWSTLASGSTGLLQPTISQGHINCRRYGILAKNVNQGSFFNLNIYLNPETGDSNYGGILLNTSNANSISFNQIAKQNAVITTSSWGIVLLDSSRNNVTGNQVYFLNDAGVFLSGALSDSNFVVNNLFFSTTKGVTGSSGARENTLILNNGLLLTGALYDIDNENYIQRRQYATTFVTTLTGGAPTETVSFVIPTGNFSTKPQSGFLMQTDIGTTPDKCIGFYNHTLSTANLAVFVVANMSGSNLTAGARRFNATMFE